MDKIEHKIAGAKDQSEFLATEQKGGVKDF
jgi:hypothetical protein